MELFNTVYATLQPLVKDFFVWVGGGGGTWYLYTLWRDRVKVDIEYQESSFDVKNDSVKVNIAFEMTNSSNSVTSLRKVASISLFGGEVGKYKGKLTILEPSRKLEPHNQIVIHIDDDVGKGYPFFLFGYIRFDFNRGISKRFYFFTTPKNNVPFFRFYLSYVKYILCGIVPT